MSAFEPVQFTSVNCDSSQGRRLAYCQRPSHAQLPGLIWLPGFRSDMTSTKAVALDAFAAERGQGLLRFDYSAHGQSSGAFEQADIGLWLEDSLHVFLNLTTGPQILIGSSMGGWIALLMARALAERDQAHRLAGMALIAPAVDFTESLMWAQFSPQIREQIMTTGQWLRPDSYANQAYPITRHLIEEGRNHLLFGGLVRSYCPVHILHGQLDPDVPWQHSLRVMEHMPSDPVSVSWIRDGEHRLSRPEDIAMLFSMIDRMSRSTIFSVE